MELAFDQMLGTLLALWWPFCRVMATLTAAPMVGEAMVPMSVRVLLSLALAVVLLPVAQPPEVISPFSLRGIVVTGEQALIGLLIGLAFHLAVATIMLLGYMVSSQMGLAMAQMNDPMNGSSSDVVSAILYVLAVLVFFAVDGHLVVTGVLGASFRAWPVGSGVSALALQTLPLQVAWVFSAALLLAIPVIFSSLVVQVGFGFLNRIAPALNLFSLGFSLVTLFGLFMLMQMVRFLPDGYLSMTRRTLDMLEQLMKAAPHG
jgi:flagellar biosynthetic protein FliR